MVEVQCSASAEVEVPLFISSDVSLCDQTLLLAAAVGLERDTNTYSSTTYLSRILLSRNESRQ